MLEYINLLKNLNDEGVQYVIIGGFAMTLYGASSVTFDLDLAVAVDESNGSSIIRALEEFHPYPPQFGSANNFVWDERSMFGNVITLITDIGKLDLLRTLPGIDSFQGLQSRSQTRNIEGVAFRIASIDDLISMKSEAARPKDLEHIRQLEAAKKLFGEG